MIKQETKRLIKKELGYKIDSGVDNTKKILIFKYGGVVFVCKGLTKKQFLDGLVRQDALQSSMQITWRKKTPDLTKASIGRMITETTSGVYSDLIEKKGENKSNTKLSEKATHSLALQYRELFIQLFY
jgi:hypothetical protein